MGACNSTQGYSVDAGANKPRSFDREYVLGKKLGSGAFAVVKEGTNKKTGKKYAIKIITNENLTAKDKIGLRDEIDILTPMRHRYIMRLYEVYEENPKFTYLVTELVTGGELFDKIAAKEYYNEKEARDTCKCLFEAMKYCHFHNVAHRDLKPQNLLLCSKNNDYDLKLADFGFAKKCNSPISGLKSMCGTINYVAPDVIFPQQNGSGYGTQADMWSVGVIVYVLLSGNLPFDDTNQRKLVENIHKGKYTLSGGHLDDISQDAKNMISSLLESNPTKRFTAEDALRCKWITKDDHHLAGNDLRASLMTFKKFNARRKFRVAVDAVVAANKLKAIVDGYTSFVGRNGSSLERSC